MLRVSRIAFAFVALSSSVCAGVASAGDVVAVVSARSQVTVLNKNQAADIFLGKTTHFPDGSPALPLDQPEGSTARDEFYSRYAGKTPAQVKAYWSKIIFTGRGQPPMEVATGIELRKRIAENPSAIGYIDQSLVDGSVRVPVGQ
jgi:ABC-type phosphate transport system substrate-binding protein